MLEEYVVWSLLYIKLIRTFFDFPLKVFRKNNIKLDGTDLLRPTIFFSDTECRKFN
jgi:hypothetical protein